MYDYKCFLTCLSQLYGIRLGFGAKIRYPVSGEFTIRYIPSQYTQAIAGPEVVRPLPVSTYSEE
jgi:hypothetical protein